MTRPDRHRIQRQVIDLTIGPGLQAPAMQEALARSFRDRAAPELEAVFDRAAGPGELLRLDRLEIDLGRIGGTDWEPQFRRRLVAELTRTLAQFRPAAQAPEGAARGEQAAAGALQQFLFFLAHGRLPWWGAGPGRSWNEALAGRIDGAGWSALHRSVLTDLRARVRFVHAVDDNLLQAALSHWCGLPDAARVLALLTPPGLGGGGRSSWRRGFWVLLLDWALAGGMHAGRGPQLMRDLLALRRSRGALDDEDSFPALRDRSDPAGAAPAGPERDLPHPWRGWLQARRAAEQGRREVPAAPAEGGGAEVLTLARPASGSAGESRKATAPGAQDEAIYLEGAGAILLHPFLEALLRQSGLLESRDFRDDAARNRAVQLLGLLTFGRAEVPEYELLLPKLLCACPFEEPIEAVELDDADRERCDALLRAVLGHWTALRSTSPQWLRAQFLLREGKLENVDGGVRLTVERRAQDVLLARLPWGIGVVGLPWLRQRIFVQWVT